MWCLFVVSVFERSRAWGDRQCGCAAQISRCFGARTGKQSQCQKAFGMENAN
jgi:hypothetical protein